MFVCVERQWRGFEWADKLQMSTTGLNKVKTFNSSSKDEEAGRGRQILLNLRLFWFTYWVSGESGSCPIVRPCPPKKNKKFN